MGIGYLLAGFLFLVNPVVHVMDLLPDCIGFFLIVKGLSKLSLFVDHLSDARERFWKLALVELVKCFSILFWPLTSDSGMLLLTFVFSIFELLLFIPALNELMDGMEFAALWYNGTAVFAKKSKKSKVPQEIELGKRFRSSTIRFYCLRILCSILPELTALQLYDYVGTVNTISIEYANYKPFLYVLLGLIVGIVGIVWLVRMCQYWKGICRDTAFQRSLKQKYELDVLPRTGLFQAIQMKRVMYCYAIAVIASLFCIVDGVNVMVGIISAGFLIAAACMMGKYAKLSYAVIPFAAIRAILSIWNFIQQIRYFDNYTIEAVEWVDKAYDWYYAMAATEMIEYIAALLGTILFLYTTWQVIRKQLTESGNVLVDGQYHKAERDVELSNLAGSRLLLGAALSLVHAIVACSYRYAIIDVPIMGAITCIVTLIWIAQTISTVSLIQTDVYERIAEDR